MIARLIYLVILLASALLLGLGMYFQYALHLHSCAPQALVRYALVLVGLFALFVVALSSGKIMRMATSVCIGMVSLFGGVVAVHQSWPRHVPLNFAAIGIDIESLLHSLPLADVMPRYFLGPVSCEHARWKMIGISGSEWALAFFILVAMAAFFAARRSG